MKWTGKLKIDSKLATNNPADEPIKFQLAVCDWLSVECWINTLSLWNNPTYAGHPAPSWD